MLFGDSIVSPRGTWYDLQRIPSWWYSNINIVVILLRQVEDNWLFETSLIVEGKKAHHNFPWSLKFDTYPILYQAYVVLHIYLPPEKISKIPGYHYSGRGKFTRPATDLRRHEEGQTATCYCRSDGVDARQWNFEFHSAASEGGPLHVHVGLWVALL